MAIRTTHIDKLDCAQQTEKEAYDILNVKLVIKRDMLTDPVLARKSALEMLNIFSKDPEKFKDAASLLQGNIDSYGGFGAYTTLCIIKFAFHLKGGLCLVTDQHTNKYGRASDKDQLTWQRLSKENDY